MNTTTSPDLVSGRDRHPCEPAAYQLSVPTRTDALARGWLSLGVLSLLGSGVFSVLLVLARTPLINRWLPGVDFFRTALVVHVDLSVLVWFFAIAGMLWSLDPRRRADSWGWAALGTTACGTALMALAPFVDPGLPVMANYIPVIVSGVFLAGLGIFAVGGILLVARTLSAPPRIGAALDGTLALRLGLYFAAVAAAVAILSFGWSLVEVPLAIDGKAYWEYLFWGGGHALQFTWTLLMLVGWLWLAHACGAKVTLSARIALMLFTIALCALVVTPYAYLAHHVLTNEHRALHTWGMRIGGGLAILPIALAVAIALARQRAIADSARPLRAALVSSMMLFAAGGLIALTINGSNVRIPAHYHGCIVGVTLAMMGIVYHLLPQFGWGRPQSRLATVQPVIYGSGQLMHITGLVWSGGYGVQRKIAGAEQILRNPGEVFGMGLMGLGGVVAVAGGMLFIVVVAQAMRQRKPQ